MTSFPDAFHRLAAPLVARVKALAARGTDVQSDHSKRCPECQVRVLAGEVRDRVEKFELYGVTSFHPPGTEHVVVSLGGNRDHSVIVASADRASRPRDLAQGEVAVYNGLAGTRVLLKADGTVEITGTSLVSIEGNVSVDGDLDVSGRIQGGQDVFDVVGSMAVMRAQYNVHTHQENGDGGGVTNPPIPPQS